MIKEVKLLLERCESQYLDSSERDNLRGGMESIKKKLFDLQIESLSTHIDEKGRILNLPKEEELLQEEMTDLR
ncbi:MAG: hypothetical protein ACXAC2_03070 [Candidatus Kariarchaeaceae archaeon]|jgi:hypothetical protein